VTVSETKTVPFARGGCCGEVAEDQRGGVGKAVAGESPELAEKIVAAINAAPDGNWIAGSEEQVRAAGHEFVRAAFEAGLQQKITAAEAAFPPSAGLNRKKKTQ
jgi:hypothetical protein